MIKYFVIALFTYILYACSIKPKDSSSPVEKRQYTEQQNPVGVIILQKGMFQKELVSNGKLVALRKSDLQFRVGEQLEKLDGRNGDPVKAGHTIAELNTFTYKQQLDNSQIQLKRARLEMQNVLIGQGYNTLDTTAIPPHIYEMASVKSGYSEAVQSLETAEFNMKSTRLVAPFDGILANIKQKQYDRINAGTTFCTLIDDSQFEVEFRMVESEVGVLRRAEGYIELNSETSWIKNEHIEYEQFLLHISRAVILSIVVFGLFSYPLQILPIKICLFIAVAIAVGALNLKGPEIIKQSSSSYNSRKFALKSILSVGCFGVLWLTASYMQQVKVAYTDWKYAFDTYNMGIYNDCLTDYKKAYPILKTNGDFLTNYGKALSMADKHIEAIEMLQQAVKYYPNTVVCTTLGDSYKKIGQTELAEKAYNHSYNMNPSRFYPKYLLVKLYNDSGQNRKAIKMAKELLKKEVKIESTAIQEIKEEMKKIIEK